MTKAKLVTVLELLLYLEETLQESRLFPTEFLDEGTALITLTEAAKYWQLNSQCNSVSRVSASKLIKQAIWAMLVKHDTFKTIDVLTKLSLCSPN